MQNESGICGRATQALPLLAVDFDWQVQNCIITKLEITNYGTA